MFSQSQVKQAFGKFVTVQLNVRNVPAGVNQVPDGLGTQYLRDEKFGNFALPYYVIVRVKGNTLTRIAEYDKGLIDDGGEFVRFLDRALEVR